MVDFVEVGEICQSCRVQAFLPFRCKYCDKFFCGDCFDTHVKGCRDKNSKADSNTNSNAGEKSPGGSSATSEATGKIYNCIQCNKGLRKDECEICVICEQRTCIKHRYSDFTTLVVYNKL